MFDALKKLFGPKECPTHGVGLCLALVREGWKCHRFGDSNFVVALPHHFPAGFDREGMLVGTIDGRSHNFSATLLRHDAFNSDPVLAYALVDRLAKKSGVTPVDKGTYRYFKDPNVKGDEQLQHTFYVIGIPGAVFVVSIVSTPNKERSEALKRIEAAIPDIIGELA